ncbi:MAG: ABC transporter permease [Bacteroidota bacterium]
MFFRKTKTNTGLSPGTIAWRKFRKNHSAFFALLWILSFMVIAFLGYIIAPDPTPMANRQNLSVATMNPGFTTTFLKKRMDVQEKQKQSWFSVMLFGKSSVYEWLAISDYSFSTDSMVIEYYKEDPKTPGVMASFTLADVLFSSDSSTVKKDYIVNYFEGSATDTLTISGARSRIEKENLVEKTFWLGTDRFGRDMLSQLIIGARISLSVGFIAIAIALLVGMLLGSLAGFYRGKTDAFIVWLINVVWSVPTLLLVIAITFALGKGFWQIFIAVGLTMWVDVARIVRGQIISVRENEFVEAGKALGLTSSRIILKHIIPNIMGPVIVISAANFASAILIEAGLSFLGVGVQPPMPSWGSMIRENYGYIILDKAFLAIIPGLAIMLLVMSFMLVGNGLRDALEKRY